MQLPDIVTLSPRDTFVFCEGIWYNNIGFLFEEDIHSLQGNKNFCSDNIFGEA